MSRSRPCLVAMACMCLGGCAAGTNVPARLDPIESPPSNVLRAHDNLQRGESLLLNGDIDASRSYFDRAVNLLLDSDFHQSSTPPKAMETIDRIAGLELDHLRDDGLGNLDSLNPLLEEVIATLLFKPTESEIDRVQEKVSHGSPVSFPVVVDSRVVAFIKAFSTVRRTSIQNALGRASEYIPVYKKLFRERGLPEDLAYLPIIESGYRMHATSRARAKGVWQFMAATARMFDLRVDWVVDERLDPFKSAVAAAKYLSTLHREYGDWYLALACYNGGTRRIDRAIRHLKTRDFFKLAQTRYLRRETRNYVPAFIAAIIIARSPSDYGFSPAKADPIFADTKWIQVPSPADLTQISRLSGLDTARLKTLNPELIRDFTPFNIDTYSLRVPRDTKEDWLDRVVRLPEEKKYFIGWYRVRRGDNLYHIARKFGTSVWKIKRVNNLNSNLIHPGDRLRIPRD